MTEVQVEPRKLFGGAITFHIPKDFVDVSNIRQVPDNQEAFIDPESDLSIVIEILQRVEKDDVNEAIKFHFQALADDNSAFSSTISEITSLNETPKQNTGGTSKPVILRGQQKVSKFNNPTPHTVSILLALFRIDVKNVDIVISVNTPANEESGLNRSSLIFTEAVSSFVIHDFDLFA